MNKIHTKDILKSIKLYPSKRLGQNFLLDYNLGKWIVDQLQISDKDEVIEIGAGLGSLSRHIVGHAKKTFLIEHDYRLAKFLKEQFYLDFENNSNSEGLFDDVKIIEIDALKFDLREFHSKPSIKLIGNLPYSISSPLIKIFLEINSPINEAIIMLQKEVCERICAKHSTKQYSSISVGIQSMWYVEHIKTINEQVFYPKPEIKSGVLHLKRKKITKDTIYDRKMLLSMVKRGFSQRRKQLKKLLTLELLQLKNKSQISWASACKDINIKENSRAEELSVDKWIQLCNYFYPINLKSTDTKNELFDVVDNENKVIGQETRINVHTNKLLHRACHIFLINNNNEIYLQNRSILKDTNQNKWDSSASGHLNVDETYVSCAKRETYEELNLTTSIDDFKLVANLKPNKDNGWEFIELFEIKYNKNMGKIKTNPSEINFGIWFDKFFVQKWIQDNPDDFAHGFIQCYKLWMSSNSKTS